MRGAMRDTSRDYRTYWLQDGLYYSRASNLGEPAACELPADKLAQIPEMERKLILDEVASNPGLCRKLYEIMTKNPNWAHVIAASMATAAANALDPKIGKVGPWVKLQDSVRTMIDSAMSKVDQTVAAMPLGKKIEVIQAIAAHGAPKLHGLGDLGQFELLGSLFTGVSNYFGSKVIASAQKDIATTQANAAIQVANSQVSIAQAQAAMAAAQSVLANPIQAVGSAVSSALTTLTDTTVAGVPVLLPIVGLIGLGLYFAFGRKR